VALPGGLVCSWSRRALGLAGSGLGFMDHGEENSVYEIYLVKIPTCFFFIIYFLLPLIKDMATVFSSLCRGF
jgi:hypothetical protein